MFVSVACPKPSCPMSYPASLPLPAMSNERTETAYVPTIQLMDPSIAIESTEQQHTNAIADYEQQQQVVDATQSSNVDRQASGNENALNAGGQIESDNAVVADASGDAVIVDAVEALSDEGAVAAANKTNEIAVASADVKVDVKEHDTSEENKGRKEPAEELNTAGKKKDNNEQSGEAVAAIDDSQKDMRNEKEIAAKEKADETMEDEDDKEDESNARRPKRRRSSITLSRYSPGEGGGLKRHKTATSEKSPDPVESAVVLKSTNEQTDKEPKTESKKKESKKKSTDKYSYPVYNWTSTGSNSANKIIHTSLSIDFGPFAEDIPLVDKDGSWKCLKCYHTNMATKARCGVCLSWKGGKRENYPKKGGDDASGRNSAATVPLIISVGDDVLISSGDTPWKDLNKMQERAEILEKDKNVEEEVSICYDDPASNEPGLAVLDPYVARIEGMWEEVDEKKKCGVAKKSLESRMMIQTRWYFRREDMEGLKLSMNGEYGVQDRIVADMTVRDLILSDQIDLNAASCILGKASVACLSSENKQKVKGGFVCRYKMNLDPQDDATGTVFPMVDSAGDRAVSKEANRRGSDYTGASSEEDAYPSRDVFSRSAYGNPMSPRRVISEGPTVGKIKVGPDHQALIPEQLNLEKKLSSRHLTHPPLDRTPILVWDPERDEEAAVDSFVARACIILSDTMTQPFHELNIVESPDHEAEARKPREICIDSLLTQLHACKYNPAAALEKITAHPEQFLTLWNQGERDQFDSNFRVYRDSLRMIAKNLDDVKTCKDVVEYHYRFKLIENFRKFKAKKQEHAREMMETVEYRMLKEKKAMEARNEQNLDEENMSSDEDGATAIPDQPSSRDGPVNSRIRTWFKTGCSKDGSEGATQKRRNNAFQLLVEVKDTVGADAYLALAKCLKSYDAQSQSLVDLKASARDIMKSHPALFERFVEFLPKKIC